MLRTLLLLLLLSPHSISWAAAPGAAAVASAHPLATQTGHAILEAGGNAFDAAVAVSAVLAVAEPYSSGIGGGGFWLLHRAKDGRDVMIDGRERAPLASSADMYLDQGGRVIDGLSVDGPLAAGIPGEPAALAHIAEHYGRLPLATTLAPAIRIAREGFEVTPHYRRMAGWRKEVLNSSPEAAAIFLRGNEVPPLGAVIRQPELAATLEALAKRGRDGFYAGPVARRLVSAVRQAGGIWSARDLAEYQVVEREPIRGRYQGMEIVSAAPPSSGGIALVEMLNILQQFDLAQGESALQTHLVVESMRRAYRDRAEYLGDSDYVDVPVDRLTHPLYAAGLATTIRPDQATPSSMLAGYRVKEQEGNDTTHFSILDGEGNYVSATLSINYPFGAGFVAGDTGVLLNDEMDDFVAKPGEPNVYGLVGSAANTIAPGKRMLSSMSPTFVRSGDGVAVLGTPGGSRIITMVLLGILELADNHSPLAWVSRPRFHHQYLPDTLFYEPGAFDEKLVEKLRGLGHNLEQSSRTWGNMQALWWDKRSGEVSAAADPRVEGVATVRYPQPRPEEGVAAR